MKKSSYEKPMITHEKGFEIQAMACNKVPGSGDANFCGPVWSGPSGNRNGCYMNPDARSS